MSIEFKKTCYDEDGEHCKVHVVKFEPNPIVTDQWLDDALMEFSLDKKPEDRMYISVDIDDNELTIEDERMVLKFRLGTHYEGTQCTKMHLLEGKMK